MWNIKQLKTTDINLQIIIFIDYVVRIFSVEQAKILSKVNKFVVFRNLENISDDEAEELSKQ